MVNYGTETPTSRRSVLRAFGLGAAAIGASPLVTACGGLKESGGSADNVIRIGYVSPRTGAASAFGESDGFVLAQARAFFKDGITANGKKYEVEILDRDTGSNPDKAATIADELLVSKGVDLVLVTSTPETIHPVADKCESEGVPCISTIEPWQGWYFGRGASPDKGFKYTYHFFDGLENVAAVESAIWGKTQTNRKVGVLWPNDADGSAFRDAKNGYRAAADMSDYTFVDPGAYENGTKDFSSIIATFKDNDVEILAGVPLPPDFTTFWTQAAQQGFRPKVATISKAILFESAVAALPNGIGDGLSIASFWVPQYPFKSSLTGQTATQLAEAYEKSPQAKGQSWNQGLGPNYALFEIANAVLTAVDPKDREAVAEQIGRTKVDTVLGTIDWTGAKSPVPHVATIPMVGTQWVQEGEGYALKVVENGEVPAVAIDDQLVAL